MNVDKYTDRTKGFIQAAQTMAVRGTPITVDVTDGGLTITKQMIWLGANVTLMLPHVPVTSR